MNESRLRVGVVGAGVGRAHLRGYAALPKAVEIVALCDADESRLEQVGNEFNIPLRYPDADALFASGKVDAVSLCVPNSLHAPLAVSALESGLHVLCEKPLAETVESGRKIVAAAAESTGKFVVAYTRRARPDVRWLKQAISEGVLGDIYQIKTGWTREAGIPGWGGWFTDKQIAGGGPLIDLGIHMLDAAMWMVGYPQPLTVSGMTFANFGPRQSKTFRYKAATGMPGQYTVEDAANAFIRLQGGINLNVEVSWASHQRPGMDDYFLSLMGTQGTAELYVANYTTHDTLTLYTEVAGAPVITKPIVDASVNDHVENVAQFVWCILDDTPPPVTAEQGLVGLQIVEAIYLSAEQGREVSLPN